MKTKSSIIYVYLGLFLSAVLIILLLNSYFLIDRTRSNLIEIYWKQGELIVKSIAVSAQQSIESIDLTDQQIRRSLKRNATYIDNQFSKEGSLNEEELTEYLIDHNLQSLTILNPENEVVFKTENTFVTLPTVFFDPDKNLPYQSDIETFSVDFPRADNLGKIIITITQSKLDAIKTRIGLQLLIASLEHQNIVQHISFIDNHFQVIADSNPNRIGESEEKIEYLDAIKSGVSFFFRDSNENTMKVIHPLKLTDNKNGVLVVGYPITRIDKIYENTFKNTILNSSVVMILAIIAGMIVVKLNNRNQLKIESMEKKIRENEKLESLANLAAGVAHEVRNPLNSVSIIIQRLQLEFTPEEETDEYTSLTDLMKREVDRINHIITDFLDFAKPFDPKKTLFSVNEFLNKAIDSIGVEAEEKGVKIQTIELLNDKPFFGDSEKLTQVVINLVRNAVDASKRGDIISVTSSMTSKNTWVLQIKDQGMGIPKENLNHIFDIYFTTKQNGTGLGLYICQKIIRAHKGSIELIPNLEKGITVSIELPLMDY